MEDTTYTPDYQSLDEVHLVLECGPINKDLPAYGSAFTVEKMCLWVTNGQAIPIRMEGHSRARITGTLYRLDRKQLIALDKRKQNGVWFTRERIKAWVKPDEEQHPWMYIGRNDYWDDRLEHDLRFPECKRTYRPAPRFIDDDPLFNRAARYNQQRIEDYDKKISCPIISPEMAAAIRNIVKTKNEEEIRRLYDAEQAKARAAARAAAPFYKRILMPK